MNKEILNSDNSCEPKRLPFQNGMSNLKFFNPSTCQPFNFTAPLSRLRHSRHKAYRAQASQGSAVPFVYRSGRELVEHFTPHSSPFTYQRAATGLFGMSEKRGFPTPYGLGSLSLTRHPCENPLSLWLRS